MMRDAKTSRTNDEQSLQMPSHPTGMSLLSNYVTNCSAPPQQNDSSHHKSRVANLLSLSMQRAKEQDNVSISQMPS